MENYRINPKKGMEIGLYSVGEHFENPHTGHKIAAGERILELIEAAKLSEQVGLDVFAVGESHQEHFATQAHSVILGSIAQATKKIKIASSSTVLSVNDPVRVYEDFSTIDLISGGRAEIVAGRGSRLGAYDLLGFDANDYEALFEEKMELLLQLNREETVTWQGEFRPPLNAATVLPRPHNGRLPIWRAVGGAPASAIKAGIAGVPLMLATLGGASMNFKQSVDAYRRSADCSGHLSTTLPVSTTSMLYVSERSQDAVNEFYPHLNTAFRALRGGTYPKEAFVQSADYTDALMVGSPQLIIEKILHQYELFGHQRILLQMDVGGVPYDKLARNIEIVANQIAPVIRKYTAK